MTTKRLYKSKTERMIDGVCGGVAEYAGVDVTLVRIAWVLLALFGGSGILLYIVAMIIMPSPPPGIAVEPPKPRSSGANSKFWGMLLVVVGLLWLMDNLGIPVWHHWWGFSWSVALPVLLILVGVAFLFGGRNGLLNTAPAEAQPAPGTEGSATDVPPVTPVRPAKLYRSRKDRKMLGVCGGIAEHVNADPTIIRLCFILGLFASFGFMLLLYIALGIIVPEEPVVPVTPQAS